MSIPSIAKNLAACRVCRVSYRMALATPRVRTACRVGEDSRRREDVERSGGQPGIAKEVSLQEPKRAAPRRPPKRRLGYAVAAAGPRLLLTTPNLKSRANPAARGDGNPTPQRADPLASRRPTVPTPSIPRRCATPSVQPFCSLPKTTGPDAAALPSSLIRRPRLPCRATADSTQKRREGGRLRPIPIPKPANEGLGCTSPRGPLTRRVVSLFSLFDTSSPRRARSPRLRRRPAPANGHGDQGYRESGEQCRPVWRPFDAEGHPCRSVGTPERAKWVAGCEIAFPKPPRTSMRRAPTQLATQSLKRGRAPAAAGASQDDPNRSPRARRPPGERESGEKPGPRTQRPSPKRAARIWRRPAVITGENSRVATARRGHGGPARSRFSAARTPRGGGGGGGS